MNRLSALRVPPERSSVDIMLGPSEYMLDDAARAPTRSLKKNAVKDFRGEGASVPQ